MGSNSAVVSAFQGVFGEASSRCAPAYKTRDEVDPNMECILDATDSRLAPNKAWMMLVVRSSRANCARKCFELATGEDWSFMSGYKQLDDIRAAARTRGVSVNVYHSEIDDVVADVDPVKGRTISLVHRDGHYDLGVHLAWDDVRGDRQAIPTREHVLESRLPPEYPNECDVKGWKQWFFAADSKIKGASGWSSWTDRWANLNEIFGDHNIRRHLAGPPVDQDDERLHQLPGWADYHRTAVRVNYKNQYDFYILPSFFSRAHHQAKLGRYIYLELGDEGARMYNTFAKRTYLPQRYVFVADAIIDPMQKVSMRRFSGAGAPTAFLGYSVKQVLAKNLIDLKSIHFVFRFDPRLNTPEVTNAIRAYFPRWNFSFDRGPDVDGFAGPAEKAALLSAVGPRFGVRKRVAETAAGLAYIAKVRGCRSIASSWSRMMGTNGRDKIGTG